MSKKVYHYCDGVPHSWRCQHTIAEMRPMMCDDCTADDVFALYTKINNEYRRGFPVMDDDRWNLFEQFCRDRFPEDRRFHKVGVIYD